MRIAASSGLATPEGGRDITEAGRALVRIDEIIATLERNGRSEAELYRRQYPEWWKALV